MNRPIRPAVIDGKALRASLLYFALVLGVGVVLGSFRVPLLVPRLGERWAELLEMPVMGLAIVLATRHVVRRFSLPADARVRWFVGGLAFVLMLLSELSLALLMQDSSLSQFIASRDPISGSVYLGMLLFFAAAPRLLKP